MEGKERTLGFVPVHAQTVPLLRSADIVHVLTVMILFMILISRTLSHEIVSYVFRTAELVLFFDRHHPEQ